MRFQTTAQLGLAALALGTLLFTGCAEKATQQPGFPQVLDLEGHPFSLFGEVGNQATVVVFTRSDCPISNRYAPVVRELYEQFHARGVEMYLVYVDPRVTPDAIRTHRAEYEYPCPALRDPEHALVAATGATVTPEAVVFDRQQRVTYRGRIDDQHAKLGSARPAATQHDLNDAIEATLAGREIAEPATKAVGCYIADLK
jgi:peroxiredoxin